MPNHITNEILVIGGTKKQRADFIRKVTNKHGHIDFDKIIRMPKSMMIDESGEVENLTAAMLGKPSRFCSGKVESTKEVIEKIRERGEKASYIKKVKIHAQLRIKNMENYGYHSWYDWSVDKWGTKWNAYSVEMPVDELKRRIKRGFQYRETHVKAYGKRVFKKRLYRHAASGGDLAIRFETAWSSPTPVIKQMARMFPYLDFHIRYADEDTGSNCGHYRIKGGEIISIDVALPWKEQSIEDNRKWTEFSLNLRYPGCQPHDFGYDENWNYIEKQ